MHGCVGTACICPLYYESPIEISTLLYREFNKKPHTSDDVRKLALLNMEDYTDIIKSVPTSIVIGPFQISVDNVRNTLIKKRRAVMEALLVNLASELRVASDGVCTKGILVTMGALCRGTFCHECEISQVPVGRPKYLEACANSKLTCGGHMSVTKLCLVWA